jgi:hypothetical protein
MCDVALVDDVHTAALELTKRPLCGSERALLLRLAQVRSVFVCWIVLNTVQLSLMMRLY